MQVAGAPDHRDSPWPGLPPAGGRLARIAKRSVKFNGGRPLSGKSG